MDIHEELAALKVRVEELELESNGRMAVALNCIKGLKLLQEGKIDEESVVAVLNSAEEDMARVQTWMWARDQALLEIVQELREGSAQLLGELDRMRNLLETRRCEQCGRAVLRKRDIM